MNNGLHCGACNTPFYDNDELMHHLNTCAAAKAILLPVTALMVSGNKIDTDHSCMHLIWQIPESRSYISEYAEAIVNDMGSFDRSKIHRRMCEKLGLDYASFRPFESSSILEIPTKQEAENIIYKALGDLMRNKLFSA